jgi:hypothetical protein
MAADAIWSGSATLTVKTDGGTSIPIAGLQELEIIPGYEHEELFTLDSTFRENVKRYEHNVSVDITYAKFDVTAAQEWLGGEGATATASQDTNDPELFRIEDVSESADGEYVRDTVVKKVHFPEFPILSKSYGEFEEWDLSGTGRTVGNLEDTSGTT